MAEDKPTATSRAEAIALGLKRYFDGQPCGRAGHLYFRTLKGHCIKCKNELEKIRVSFGEARQNLIDKRIRTKASQAAYHRRRYLENPQPYKDRAKKRAASLPPDDIRAGARKRQATYRSKNTGRHQIDRRVRRARKFGNGGSHTQQDIIDIFSSQGGRCAYCRCRVTMKNKHVDHIRPLSKGGSNDRCNLQILCKSCNLQKGAKDPIEYVRSQGMLL